MKNHISLPILLLCIFSMYTATLSSQKLRELEVTGFYSPTNFTPTDVWGFNIKYNYWLYQYLGFTCGFDYNHSSIDKSFKDPKQSQYSYSIDKSIDNFSAILGIKLATPTFKNFGLIGDLLFTFEPIPYNVISFSKYMKTENHQIYSSEKSGGFSYTKFNPSYRGELSLFYQFNDEDPRIRLAIGGAITDYNPYNTYYRAEIEGVKLRDYLHLKPKSPGFMFFLRFMVSL